MMRTSVSRAGRLALSRSGARRRMGGGPFNHEFDVHKSKLVEEWNGRRELTDIVFQVNMGKLPHIFAWLVGFPYFVYWMSKTESKKYDPRRYKETF
mmetsp:Transcript_1523/g.2081  ORF Transcript_1523/g.2081 Transcript_1523/m.2081 type:complete len:96 (+) Transcript_1523:37-324(+)